MAHRHGSPATVLAVALIAAALVFTASESAFAQSAVTPPGTGTSANPYLISEVGHLVWIGDNVATSTGKYYTMTADIDASSTATWNDAETGTDVLEGFQPIGTSGAAFDGVFDGQGHTISGMVINRPATYAIGLFGSLDVHGEIRNLGVVDDLVTGSFYVGGVVGLGGGKVSNCYASGVVTGSAFVGGLVGYNDFGTVSNCYATGLVTGSSDIGGLVGCIHSRTVSNCYAAAAVSGFLRVGGLIGTYYEGTVSHSYWDIQASGLSTSSGGTDMTTAEMKQQATFTGWDFSTIWGIAEGASYPYLRAFPPPFKLTVYAAGAGSVTVDPPSADGTYAPGTVVTLTATPNGPDSSFLRWTGAARSESQTVTVVMDIQKSVVASFQTRIEISSPADLARIGNDPAYPLANVLYVLTSDIDASNTVTWNDAETGTDVLEGFKPIGTRITPFTGIFDGNGHTISGLVINRPATDNVGFFGYLGRNGQVRNLSVASGAIQGGSYVGNLVGSNCCGTVSNCHTSGVAKGTVRVGGLVGTSTTGVVSNCYAAVAVKGTGDGIGGLVGNSNSDTISNCYATGAVTGAYCVGGLVGEVTSVTVSNCCATGTITSGSMGGGLLGLNDHGTVSNCYATGPVAGSSDIGGLVGYDLSGAVSNSYWDTQASGLSASAAGTGKTTAEMNQQATFAAWDFTTVWSIAEGVSYPYPRFSPPPFKLAINISGSGGVTVNPPSADGTYAPGTVVTLTAAPNAANDVFFRWAGAAPADSQTVTVVMDIHRSVTAAFLARIEIHALADLAKIGNDPAYPLSDVLYVLMADIDASATATWNDAGTTTDVLEGFKPIGDGSAPFTGVFDGNGHTIRGLVINRPDVDYVGLFGYVGLGGQVRNLGVVGGTVTGAENVGALVGYNYYGTISNCHATAAITGSYNVGGLIGYNDSGTTSTCHADGAVTGAADYVGGLIGVNRSVVSNCYASGAVTGSSYVGGLVGYTFCGTVSNCFATGAVAGTGEDVGGLVGHNESGKVLQCYATGAVTGAGNGVGGLIGNTYSGRVSSCYTTGTITGVSNVGGLVGYNDSTRVSRCYATGAITGTGDNVGGLIGDNYSGSVSTCYASGAVAGSSYIGGLIGYHLSYDNVWICYATGTVTGTSGVGGLMGYSQYDIVYGSYWDTQTTGQSTSAGGGIGKTTAEMKQQATFADWDFASVWGIVENVTYPFLRNLDSDADGVPNAIDACPGTVQGAPVDAQGCPAVVFGDFNRDGAVNQADLAVFSACITGPAVLFDPQNAPAGCTLSLAGGFLPADHDQDSDVDQEDFGIFQRCWSGASPADPACAN